MKRFVLFSLLGIIVFSLIFYREGGEEILTILVGLALPTVPAWVIWQVIKLLKGPSVPIDPEREAKLEKLAEEDDSIEEGSFNDIHYDPHIS